MITEPPQDWGNRLLRGHKKKTLVHTRTQEKGVVTPQETEPDSPVSVQESSSEAWVNSGLLQVRDTEYNSSRSHGVLA